jgi:hypothetical protein
MPTVAGGEVAWGPGGQAPPGFARVAGTVSGAVIWIMGWVRCFVWIVVRGGGGMGLVVGGAREGAGVV